MPEYKLSILVDAQDRASTVLSSISNGINAFDVALGNLIANGIQAASSAMVEFGRQGLQVGADYQTSLNIFQSVSSATADQMAQVAQLAKELGADMTLPATSAANAAQAMTELAKGGLDVANAMEAAKGTLALAASAGVSEARAAEIAANALQSFNLEGNRATMVADLFSAAANKSSLEVTDVADAFKMASAVFSSFQGEVVGQEAAMVDLTTALALLGNVGIKGSDAGTSLKQMLLQLAGPSSVAKDQMIALMYAAQGATGAQEALDMVLMGNAKERGEGLTALAEANPQLQNLGDIAYDAAGNMRPLGEIIDLVSRATASMSAEQRNAAITTIFGADASRAVIGLMRAGPEAFAAMEQSITAQGAAAELAGARMAGLGGAIEGFKSTLETTQLETMEPLMGPLEIGIRALAGALEAATPSLVSFVANGVAPSITAAANFLDRLVSAPSAGAFLVQTFTDTAAAASEWAAQLTGRAVDAARAWATQTIASAQAQLPAWIESLAAWGVAATQWVVDAAPGLLANLFNLRNQAIVWIASQAPGWIEALQPWSIALLQWVVDAAPGLLLAFGATTGLLLDGVGAALPGIVEGLSSWGAALVDWVFVAAPGLLANMATLGNALLAWIIERVPTIATYLGEWAVAFIGWVGETLPRVIIGLGQLLAGVINWIVAPESGGQLGTALESWIPPFVAFITEKLAPALIAALSNIGQQIWSQLGTLWQNAWSEGTRGDALLRSVGLRNDSGGESVPGFAGGVTNFRGGWAIVGEQGPELVRLPGGADVIPAAATRAALSGGGAGGSGVVNNISVGTIVVQGTDGSRETAQRIREELIQIARDNSGNTELFGGW